MHLSWSSEILWQLLLYRVTYKHITIYTKTHFSRFTKCGFLLADSPLYHCLKHCSTLFINFHPSRPVFPLIFPHLHNPRTFFPIYTIFIITVQKNLKTTTMSNEDNDSSHSSPTNEDQSFDIDRHIRFLEMNYQLIPSFYEGQEINHLTLAYFVISGLHMLHAIHRVSFFNFIT